MPIFFNNASHDIAFGRLPIEKMGGDVITYSMYGENIPVIEAAIDEKIIKVVGSGTEFLFYLTNKGNVYGTGENMIYQFGENYAKTKKFTTLTLIATKIRDIACGSTNFFYITKSNELWGIGSNSHGRLGIGVSGARTTFTKLASNVKSVCAGNVMSCYIDLNDDLYCCGYNIFGQQGDGTTEDVLTFTKRAENVRYVDCTAYWTIYYIDNDDNLYACGYGSRGQLGNGNKDLTTFTKIRSNVKKIVTKPEQAGVLWIIDNNDNLYGGGDISIKPGTTNTVIPVELKLYATNVRDISQSTSSVYAFYVTNDDQLYGYGMNHYGNQGNGASVVYNFTKRADNIREVFCSRMDTFYINNNNELYVAGYNNYGQHGNGNTSQVNIFTKRAENVKTAFEIFYGNIIYFDQNGDLYGAGYNDDGQFGLGNTIEARKFVQIKLPEE